MKFESFPKHCTLKASSLQTVQANFCSCQVYHTLKFAMTLTSNIAHFQGGLVIGKPWASVNVLLVN